mmetsp:Transcript_32757/g.53132  ORF Transcript_32757/g.53132 Transcript_32757/m.53132 type:complete len:129 (+) Transcript_32757:1993-2379(+)
MHLQGQEEGEAHLHLQEDAVVGVVLVTEGVVLHVVTEAAGDVHSVLCIYAAQSIGWNSLQTVWGFTAQSIGWQAVLPYLMVCLFIEETTLPYTLLVWFDYAAIFDGDAKCFYSFLQTLLFKLAVQDNP